MKIVFFNIITNENLFFEYYLSLSHHYLVKIKTIHFILFYLQLVQTYKSTCERKMRKLSVSFS